MNRGVNPFGLLAFLHWNHPWNHFHFPESLLPKAVDQIKRLGVGTVRMDILWSDVQGQDGRFAFDRYRKILTLLTQAEIQPLAILHYNKYTQQDDPGQPRWNDPPADLEEFARYVKTTVTHFKDLVSHWEIWNEPNLAEYWTAPKDGLKLYSSLLKKSYQAAKEADPRSMVLHGGLTEPVVEDVANLYTEAGNSFFDKVNIHTFINPADPDRRKRFDKIIEGVKHVMEKNGDGGKKIWITEMGCPGIPRGSKLNWFGGGPIEEEKQAEWIKEQYSYLESHPIVEKMFWAFYRDTEGEFNDATDYLGLVRKDLSEKPAFKAYQEIIKAWKNPTPSLAQELKGE